MFWVEWFTRNWYWMLHHPHSNTRISLLMANTFDKSLLNMENKDYTQILRLARLKEAHISGVWISRPIFDRQGKYYGYRVHLMNIRNIGYIYSISHLPWDVAPGKAQGSFPESDSSAFSRNQFVFRRSMIALDWPRKTSQLQQAI